MIRLDDLRAKANDYVPPKFNELLRRLEGWLNARAGAGIRSRRNDMGTTYIADTSASARFIPAFKVRLDGDKITVGTGTVNGRVPMIGEALLDAPSPPAIPIKGLAPNAQSRSWIVVQAIVTIDGEISPDDPKALTVLHVADLDSPRREANTGWHPLAMLVWDKSTPKAVHQIAMHSVNHAATLGSEGEIERHLFWAV